MEVRLWPFVMAFSASYPENSSLLANRMTRMDLCNSLSVGVASMFPAVSEKYQNRVGAADKTPIPCHCRLPVVLPMVKCTKCQEYNGITATA